MSRFFRVISAAIKTLRNSPGDSVVITADATDKEAREVEFYQLPGVRSVPCEGERAVTLQVNGYRVAVASHNYKIDLDTEKGELSLYSSDEQGDTIQARIDLRNTGEITAGNESGEITLSDIGAFSAKNEAGSIGIDEAGLVSAGNTAEDLKLLFDQLLDDLLALQTTGSPTNHALNGNSVAAFTALKIRAALLLKEAE